MSGNDRADDDLTVIKYIGPDRQQWLRDDLSIRSFQDLSERSVVDIKECLKKHGTGVSEQIIEAWISDAKALAKSAREEKQARAVDTATSQRQKEPSSKKKEGKKKEGWESVGIFVVNIRQRTVKGRKEYLTEVSIHENGEQADSAEWSGIERDESFRWMLQQAGLAPTPSEPGPQPGEALAKEAPPAEKPEGTAEVTISQIQVFQPPNSKKPIARSEDGTLSLSAGKPFSLGVHFSIGGKAAQAITRNRETYRLQIVANEYEKKEGIDLGDSKPVQLTEMVLDYDVKSPEASLPAGEYRLWAMLTIQAAHVRPNFLELPSVTVI